MKRLLLFTLAALTAITAGADAATINVRIEGQSSTLFEGPIATKGRNVQSLSERASGAIRRCDGTNNGGTLAPTGTAATVDALSTLGKGFDGQWYDEYEDYLISRLGDETRSWRLFRNGAFTTVGGCQLRLNDNDAVLWAGTGGGLLALSMTGSTVTTAADATVYLAGADGSQGQVLGTTNGSGQLTVNLPGGGLVPDKGRQGRDGSLQSLRLLPVGVSCQAGRHAAPHAARPGVLRPWRFGHPGQPGAGRRDVAGQPDPRPWPARPAIAAGASPSAGVCCARALGCCAGPSPPTTWPRRPSAM